jgi:hypothetical protein
MASKPKKALPATTPDLPTALAEYILSAGERSLPSITEEDAAQLSDLWEMMRPCLVLDPRYRGQGDPPKVLREPLLMISWDRRAGGWKISISDKVLNLAGSMPVTCLANALCEANRALANRSYPFSERKVT